jgi:hypothetical protein
VSTRNRVGNDLSNLRFALEHYRIDRGRYPRTLEELILKFVALIASDRFSNSPSQYVPTANTCRLNNLSLVSIDNQRVTDGQWLAEQTLHVLLLPVDAVTIIIERPAK